jgi:hypothetical protein
MTSLSPATQAVINSTAEQVLADRRIKIEHIAAAALRAAADQVVPEPQGDPTTWTQCAFLGVREDLLAIATELEGQ